MTETKKFCLLTFGRAGSTALINTLQAYDDIAVPNKNVDCVDNELIHVRFVGKYANDYGRLTQRNIATVNDLINAFYDYNAGSPYAGFKSMPNRHGDFLKFASREDIRFITLVREDIPSTVASFMVARTHQTWRRDGGKQQHSYDFTEQEKPHVFGNLQHIAASLHVLKLVPRAIRLTYEQLCSPDFNNDELDEFFGRHICLQNPKPPTSAENYVTNWPQFCDFVNNAYTQIQRKLASGAPPQVAAPYALSTHTQQYR